MDSMCLFGLGFSVEAHIDGVDIAVYPRYGGKIITPGPDSRTVFMEYEEETWRLPRPQFSSKRQILTTLAHHATLNNFSILAEHQAPCPNITTTRGYRAHRRTPPILRKLSAHYTGSRAQSANTERDASNHDITMFGMSRCRQTLSKSISDHQISAKRHEF